MHPAAPVIVQTSLVPVLAPITVAVVGWIVTHILSLRAQKRIFRNQILDRARLDVTAKLRDYQGWLGELSVWIRTLGYSKAALLAGITPNFRAKADQLLALQQRSQDTRAWSRALEDYEILFPETALARFRLDRRHIRCTQALEPAFSSLLRLSLGVPTVPEIEKVIQDAQAGLALVEDQAALVEDLRVHLQNVTLSETMGRTIPTRNPPDKTVPRLVRNRSGALEVVDATGKPLDEGGATPSEIGAALLANKDQKVLPPN